MFNMFNLSSPQNPGEYIYSKNADSGQIQSECSKASDTLIVLLPIFSDCSQNFPMLKISLISS